MTTNTTTLEMSTTVLLSETLRTRINPWPQRLRAGLDALVRNQRERRIHGGERPSHALRELELRAWADYIDATRGIG